MILLSNPTKIYCSSSRSNQKDFKSWEIFICTAFC